MLFRSGLVGWVDAVTASAAQVQLITDPASLVNAYIVEADSDGVVRGSVTSDLTIELVSQDITLEFGQTIQTICFEYPYILSGASFISLDSSSS